MLGKRVFRMQNDWDYYGLWYFKEIMVIEYSIILIIFIFAPVRNLVAPPVCPPSPQAITSYAAIVSKTVLATNVKNKFKHLQYIQAQALGDV